MIRKYYKHILLFALMFKFSACESIVDDLNKDPNNPTDASASLILTSAQLADITIHESHVNRIAGLWSGYFTGVGRQYTDIYVYNINGDTFNQIWENIYYGVLEQANIVIEKSTEVNNQLLIGIAKVLKAHALGAAATGWGDVPFTEAANSEEFPNPQFDNQLEVFAGVQTMLDDAIADFESGIGSVGAADIFYQGDAAKWIQAAYTLKARLYMETKEYDLAYQAAQMGISSAAGSMWAPHGTIVGANQNTLFTFLATSRAGDMNSRDSYAAELLDPTNPMYRGNAKTDESARYRYNFIPAEFARFTTGTEPNTYSLSAGDSINGFAAQDAAFPLITYSENLLTLAEAGARAEGFATGLLHLNEFRTYMNTGGYIDPSITNVGYTLMYAPYVAADFSAGGMASTAGLSADQSLLQEILEERYLTFFGQTLGFNDIRRTREEAVGIKLEPNAGSQLPERFIYAQNEINSNTSVPNPVPGIFDPTRVNE